MGLLVRFPLERARAIPPCVTGGDSASILVLPVVRIERGASEKSHKQLSKPRTRNGGRPRRRTKRPA